MSSKLISPLRLGNSLLCQMTLRKIPLRCSQSRILSKRYFSNIYKSYSDGTENKQSSATVTERIPLGRLLKTHKCGCLRTSDAGKTVKLRGHVHYNRGTFIHIRDNEGVTQIVVPEESDLSSTVKELTYESYVEVCGVVQERPPHQVKKDLATGEIEVSVNSLNIISLAPARLPFNVRNYAMPTESLRLKHVNLYERYDHRQNISRVRSDFKNRLNDYLWKHEDFEDIFTPTMTGFSAGGANLFMVCSAKDAHASTSTDESEKSSLSSSNNPKEEPPLESSRFETTPGSQNISHLSSKDRLSAQTQAINYYCLAQSPQIYKQLLMMGGHDKYYQFAVCYRDETGRPDRQPEFMQLDMEMVDVTVEEIHSLVERLILYSWPSVRLEKFLGAAAPSVPTAPFPVMTYADAMSQYGSDKPDTRFDWKLRDVTSVLQSERFTATQLKTSLTPRLDGVEMSHCARAFAVPNGHKFLTKKVHKNWEALAAREYDMPGVSFLTCQSDDTLKGPLAKFFDKESGAELIQCLGVKPGDAVVMTVGPSENVSSLLGRLRLLGADLLESCGEAVRDKTTLPFLWVVDFPLFEKSEDGDSTAPIQSVHHPFTQPHPEDMHLLRTDPLKVRSLAYDLVCAGSEVGGGSQRIYDAKLQREILEMLHIPPGELEFFVEALAMGAPPHAGIALGLDRLVVLMCQVGSLKDVMAFPKTSQGRCPMFGIPAPVPQDLS